MIYTKTVSLIEQEFVRSYDVSSTIRHKGEKGRQRENGLAKLLKNHLPLAYGVATGEIFPYKGEEASPQCDIIIYDHLHFPVLGRNDSVQQIPLEAVYCVIEVKSMLDNQELKDARRKFDFIESMPRWIREDNKPRRSSKIPKKRYDQPEIFFLTFGFKSKLSEKAIIETHNQYNSNHALISLDKGIGFVVGDAVDSKHIWWRKPSSCNGEYYNLALMFWLIMQSIQTTDLGKPDLFKMVMS